MLVGLDSQRLAGKLTHLQLEINPLYLEAPVPVRFFPEVSLLRSIRISKKIYLIVLAVASQAHFIFQRAC